MATEIELPDGTILEAPDGVDPSVVAKAYLGKQKQLQQPLPAEASQAPQTRGIMQRLGLLGDDSGPTYRGPLEEAVGLGETALQLGTGTAASAVGGLAGIAGTVIPGEEGQGARWTENVQQALTYQPRGFVGQRTSAALAKPAEAIDRFATWVGGATGDVDDTLGATAVKTALLAVPTAVGLRGMRGAPRTAAPPTPKVPSVSQLKTQAARAYDAAENAGIVVSRDSLAGAVERLRQAAAQEGIDSTLHPDSLAALKKLMDSNTEHVSVKGLENLRRTLSDAASSTKPADRRMARVLLDKFDEYADNLGPQDILGASDPAAAVTALRSARDLWSRARKGEIVEELIRKATVGRSKFSMSGLENSLRNDFRALARNDKKMRQFSAAERAAIEMVAKGGPVGNLLRDLGKYAPTGIIPTIMGMGAGFAFGGPIGAAAVPIAGGLARYGATAITRRNALAASELVRKGRPNNALAKSEKRAPKNALATGTDVVPVRQRDGR